MVRLDRSSLMENLTSTTKLEVRLQSVAQLRVCVWVCVSAWSKMTNASKSVSQVSL